MDKPLVSCVCMTYDRPELLNELLFCFLNQDYENKELIILNDQMNVMYKYNDPRVKIFNYSDRFPSLGNKRNRSRELVNGDYIFIMDDDDIYYSNHISRLLNFHLENNEFDIVGNGMCHFSQDNKDIQEQPDPLAFNGACIKREYYLTHKFPDKKSAGEDLDYIQDAKVMKTTDDETSWHYRWGLDVWHISGWGEDGVKSWEFKEYITKVGDLKIVQLKPEISDAVKEYYR